MIKSILIIDDDERVTEAFARNLKLLGYQVSTAVDGQTGLAQYFAASPDVTLVDVRMPGMDGFAVLRAIHERAPEAEVLFITGHGDMNLAIEALRAGAADFVPKPVDMETLETVLQRAEARLRLKRRLQANIARFLWVVEHAEVGYVMIDAADHILYANPRARLFLGLPESATDSRMPLTPLTETFTGLAQARYTLYPESAWADWPAFSADMAADVPLYLVQPNTSKREASWLRVDRTAMQAEDEARYLIRLKDVSTEVSGRSFAWSFERMLGHKIKDPLGQLTGFLQLLEEDLPGLSPETLAADLAEARQAAQMLQERIMSIFKYLEVPGLGRGTCVLAGLPDLVAQIKQAFQLETINLQMDSALAECGALSLAPQALELILWELCENARKFHPTHTPTIAITVTETTAGVNLRVTDDGVYLSPEALRRIGTPYFQDEGTFTAEIPGMGLGLAMVAALVWDVGGTCRVYNRADKPGVVVELLLPHT